MNELTELQKLNIIAGALSEKGCDCEEGSIEQGEYRQCLAYIMDAIITYDTDRHHVLTGTPIAYDIEPRIEASMPWTDIVIAVPAERVTSEAK